MLEVIMSPTVVTEARPSSADAPAGSALPIDAHAFDAESFDADLFDDADELLVEEISIDGMCGVY